jgi:hypothetical protein
VIGKVFRRFRRGFAVLAPVLVLSGFIVVSAGSPAGADTTTFSSADIGASGTTPDFTQNGPWTMSWSYSDCSGFGTDEGQFAVNVNQPDDSFTSDVGPEEDGDGSSGVDYFYDTGTFSLDIESDCTWSISVAPGTGGALAAPTTYSSAQTGETGNPQAFSVGGNWTMSWRYDCSKVSGSDGIFLAFVNQPQDDGHFDAGAQEFGVSGSGSGTDYYYDTGVFNLSMISNCDWSITITPSTAGALPAPVNYTSAQSGLTANPQAFSVAGKWTMAWNYDCSSGEGEFVVGINEPATDTAADSGPFQDGSSGSGTNTYNDAGTFSLAVESDCTWSIAITSDTPTTSTSSSNGAHGYWLVGSDGGIFTFGSAQFLGSTGAMALQRPVVGITPTADNAGYWLVGSDGGVFTFGDAGFHNSIPGIGIAPAGSAGPRKLNAPIVGMVPSEDGGGYFMVAADGGVFAFGDAKFEGSCPGIGGCSGAAVAVMPDATGNGYWLVTTTGHVYAFGDAVNYGQPGPQAVPVTAAVRTPDGKGYWLLFSNGVVAPYGDATNLGNPAGSLGGTNPASAIFTTSSGHGYWIATANGSVFHYGDATNDGGMSGQHLNGSIIAGTGW